MNLIDITMDPTPPSGALPVAKVFNIHGVDSFYEHGNFIANGELSTASIVRVVQDADHMDFGRIYQPVAGRAGAQVFQGRWVYLLEYPPTKAARWAQIREQRHAVRSHAKRA